MPENPSDNLRKRRKDLSPYMFHFCKGENAEDILIKILQECQLVSENGVICFTEAPLTSNLELLDYMNMFDKPMYSKFGIGFDRNVLIKEYRARPVIYGSLEEKSLIDPKIQWRFQRFDVTSYDFSWLREWRIVGAEFNFSRMNREDIVVIAPDEFLSNFISENYTIECEYENEYTGSSGTYEKEIPFRIWKGVSFESVRNLGNDSEIQKKVEEQKIMADL